MARSIDTPRILLWIFDQHCQELQNRIAAWGSSHWRETIMIERLSRIAAIAALACSLSMPAMAAQIYNFTSFDGPGNNGGGTTVNGLNNNGDLVGFTSDNAATPTFFSNFIRNANGTFTALPIA